MGGDHHTAVSQPSVFQSSLLSRINERQVFRTLQAHGPLSRAEVARRSGISVPTASKAVESLLRAGLLEEGHASEAARGRPARHVRLANRTAGVLGLVLDVGLCRLVGAGLDGKLHSERAVVFPTPPTYEGFLDAATDAARSFLAPPGAAMLGLGISMPGLIDTHCRQGILSPNLPMTDGRSPSLDLAERLGLECVLVQEAHALCLAERWYGAAKDLEDFAVLDVTTGVGLGVMSGGRLLNGHSGLAGEIGHITVQPNGRLCGCGNLGCLETLACDAALAELVSHRLGRRLSLDDLLGDRCRPGVTAAELDDVVHYLGIGLAAVVNLFNPATLFVHGRLFELEAGLFDRVLDETRRRALPPSLADCRIVRAQATKPQGAVAAIIEHLTNALVPVLPADLFRATIAASDKE